MVYISMMGSLLYNTFLMLYKSGAHVAALWNKKAAQWVSGRTNQPIPQSFGLSQGQTVWMHCASLGEFEQGRPLLEAIREAYPSCKIVLTFFSPSGYEIRKNYTGADKVLYMPMDNAIASKKFIQAINPSLVLWVKYEYWYYYLQELSRRHIPVLLVSGIFRESQPFFKWYGGFWKKILSSFEHFFVQTSHSKELLASININQNITVTGDTRFDRVIAIAEQGESLGELIQQFCQGHPVIVAGSTWEEDEEELIHYARTYPHIRFIFAPHEISEARIKDLQEEFPE
ncbi:MAG: 3-deoxy-D-manno-octulosonic acid transferase, partial [Chitinophagaceae bacterium]